MKETSIVEIATADIDNWDAIKVLFDERQRKEIILDLGYAEIFNHGTDGHNARLIIARLAKALDKVITALPEAAAVVKGMA